MTNFDIYANVRKNEIAGVFVAYDICIGDEYSIPCHALACRKFRCFTKTFKETISECFSLEDDKTAWGSCALSDIRKFEKMFEYCLVCHFDASANIMATDTGIKKIPNSTNNHCYIQAVANGVDILILEFFVNCRGDYSNQYFLESDKSSPIKPYNIIPEFLRLCVRVSKSSPGCDRYIERGHVLHYENNYRCYLNARKSYNCEFTDSFNENFLYDPKNMVEYCVFNEEKSEYTKTRKSMAKNLDNHLSYCLFPYMDGFNKKNELAEYFSNGIFNTSFRMKQTSEYRNNSSNFSISISDIFANSPGDESAKIWLSWINENDSNKCNKYALRLASSFLFPVFFYRPEMVTNCHK